MQSKRKRYCFAVLRRLGGAVLFRSSCPSPNQGAIPFWLLKALTFRSNRPAFCGRLYLSPLVPSYSALCRPAFIPALRQSQRFLLWGFGAAPGFACLQSVKFQAFWPPALVQQAPPAIILAALRRFRGAALFRSGRVRLQKVLAPPLAFGSNSAFAADPPTAAAELLSVSPLFLFMQARQTSFHPLRLFHGFPLGFGALPGFACVRLVGFRPFGPLALLPASALPASFLQRCAASWPIWLQCFSWSCARLQVGRPFSAFGSNSAVKNRLAFCSQSLPGR